MASKARRWRCVGDASVTNRRLVGDASTSRRLRAGVASATHRRSDADASSATRWRCVGTTSCRRRVSDESAPRRRRVASPARCVGNASPGNASASYRRGTASRGASGWRCQEMMMKTCQAIGRARQDVGDTSMTRGRRIGVASAMLCRIGDASAMRRVGAGCVALVVWRGEEMMLRSRQAMGRVR